MEYNKLAYSNALPGYLENALLVRMPFYHTDLKNNLENIVFNKEPEQNYGVLERVFSHKCKANKASVTALLKEVELRESLDSHLINKIDDEICRHHTYLMRLEDLKPQYMPDLSNTITATRKELENSVLELEKEKRKEYLECWRDLMFLKKYLLSSLKDYWNLVKKREVLEVDLKQIKNENSKGY